MITSPAFRGKRYAVLGLARSGLATVDALLASGASVVAWDASEEARQKILPGTGRGTARSVVEGGSPEALRPEPAALHQPLAGPPPRAGEDPEATPLQGRGWGGGDVEAAPGLPRLPHPPAPSPEGEGELTLADPLTIDLAGFDGVVVSPGVPINRHPIADAARAAGVPLVGDVELFAQARASLPAHKVVGITGTNGKSTTTALVHHILQTAGVPSLMGGNIGLPILSRDPLPEGGVYVLELSSYQIDLTFTLDCDVAVLLNITPDHLDRYDGFEAYAASKARLFEMQCPGHQAIINFDEERRTHREDDVFWLIEGGVPLIDQPNWPSLQGPHNGQNAAAAIIAGRALGIDMSALEIALRTYPGLPHRMERIVEKAGVLYVNDSKATNPTSTAPALAAYPAVHWIVGGLAKTDDLDACEPYLGHVRAAYTIGDSAAMYERLLRGRVPMVENVGTLDAAVRRAAAAAQPGEVVLLSPACASFDQFRDYEARGDAFRAAVELLA